MSKKDYQAIAAALYLEKPDRQKPCGVDRHNQWTRGVNAVMNALAEGHPRFDPERFIEACETGKCRGAV